MTTKTRPARLTMQRGTYRIGWEGGEYAYVTMRGCGIIDRIDMRRPDGSIPAVSREALREAVNGVRLASWNTRFAVGGTR